MQCPVCKADNAGGPLCRRCKADLSLLYRLEARRDGDLADARRALHEGRFGAAVRFALHADGLRSGAESRRLVAMASLAAGHFDRALRYHAAVLHS